MNNNGFEAAFILGVAIVGMALALECEDKDLRDKLKQVFEDVTRRVEKLSTSNQSQPTS